MNKTNSIKILTTAMLCLTMFSAGCSNNQKADNDTGSLIINNDSSSMPAETAEPTPSMETEEPHTLTVVMNNGEGGDGQYTVEVKNGQVNVPKTPERQYMQFTGWYSDPECTTEFDFNSIMTEDKTVYAGWELPNDALIDLRDLPDFTFVSQVKPTVVRMGCETAALLMALKTTGHIKDMDYYDFLDLLPKTDTDNPYLGFAGILYGDSAMVDAVMPNVITEWGNEYGTAVDISKKGEIALINALENGHPVVVWTSVHFKPSETIWYDSNIDPSTVENANFEWNGSTLNHWEYKTLNHVMTLLGYNAANGDYLVGDPAEWQGETYWVSHEQFMNSWDCYQGAVEVY